VTAAKVAMQGFGHEVLADGPSEGGQGEGKEKTADENSGVGVAAGVVEGVIKKEGAEGGKNYEEDEAKVFVFFHVSSRAPGRQRYCR